MFRPLIYGHLQVLVQSSLRKRVLYLLGLGGGKRHLTLQLMGIVVWYCKVRSHFTNYGYCGLVL
jgi:hypothetical protein